MMGVKHFTLDELKKIQRAARTNYTKFADLLVDVLESEDMPEQPPYSKLVLFNNKAQFESLIKTTLQDSGDDISRLSIYITRLFLENNYLSGTTICQILQHMTVGTLSDNEHLQVLQQMDFKVYNVNFNSTEDAYKKLNQKLEHHLQKHLHLQLDQLSQAFLSNHIILLNKNLYRQKNFNDIAESLINSYTKAFLTCFPQYQFFKKKLDLLRSISDDPSIQLIQNTLNKADSTFKHLQLLLWQYVAPKRWQQAVKNLSIDFITNQPNTLHWLFRTIIHKPFLYVFTNLVNQLLTTDDNWLQLDRTLKNNPPSLVMLFYQALQQNCDSAKLNTVCQTDLESLLNRLHSHISDAQYIDLLQQDSQSTYNQTLLGSYFKLLNSISRQRSDLTLPIAHLLNQSSCHLALIGYQPFTYQALNHVLTTVTDQQLDTGLWDKTGMGIAYLQKCLPQKSILEQSQITLNSTQQQAQDCLYDLIAFKPRNDKLKQTLITEVPHAKLNLWTAHKRGLKHTQDITKEAQTLINAKLQNKTQLNPDQQILFMAFNIPRYYTSTRFNKGIYKTLQNETQPHMISQVSELGMYRHSSSTSAEFEETQIDNPFHLRYS